MIEPHLEVRALSKRFTMHMLGGASPVALDEVSFSVKRGTFLAIVGRSGSGKSSLLRCLYRRYLPTSGEIIYTAADGPVDLAAASDQEILALRRVEIGYVSQFLRATPRVLAVDVVAAPLLRQGVGIESARERAGEMLSRLGLAEPLHTALPATMSGGEQQRVNVARALCARPRLLLVDEPTSALDSETRARAIDALSELKDQGVTVVGVFHDQEAVDALADEVLELEDGAIVRHAAHDPDLPLISR
ncbi:MAG: ATP-binding cassette domain-containing protein [Solirubrobacterales bacterium]|nr:ATP-binding cassette domain-containing protein [Solirubrobacterales bacterium]